MNQNNPKVKTAKNGIPYEPARLIESSTNWYIQYHIYDAASDSLKKKRYYKIKGNTSQEKRKEARTHIRRINKALHEGVYIKAEETPPEEKSVKDAIEYVINIKERELSKRSGANYRIMLGVFLEYLKAKKMLLRPIEMIKTSDIVLFLDWLMKEKGVGPSTRNNYRRYVGTAFIEIYNRDWVKENPVAKIPKLKVPEKEYRSFKLRDYQKVNHYLEANHHRLWEFTQFIYYGFIRPVEITRLKVGHIQLDKRVILIAPADTKNGQFKPIEITKSLRMVIENMKLDQYPPEYYVFSGEKGWPPGRKYLWRNRVSEAHKKILQEIGLDNQVYDMYSHKHTGNERAVTAGMDVYWIMRQNRHSSLEQTMIYLRGLGVIRKEAQEKDW